MKVQTKEEKEEKKESKMEIYSLQKISQLEDDKRKLEAMNDEQRKSLEQVK